MRCVDTNGAVREEDFLGIDKENDKPTSFFEPERNSLRGSRPGPVQGLETKRLLGWALLVEGGAVLIAVVLGQFLGHPPWEKIAWNLSDVGLGVVVTLPLVCGLWLAVKYPLGPWGGLLRMMDQFVIPLFSRCRVWELGWIAFLAGVGEEMLFRGVLQDAAGEWFGVLGLEETAGLWLAVGVVSGLFGVLHWLTPFYALLAGLIGAYLGWWRIYSGNLLGPMVAHGVYDFIALVYLTKIRRRLSGP